MSEEQKLRRYLEKVTVDLRKANRRVGDLERQAQEPIAIVGMSCRYPGGVGSPEELWCLVSEGRDVIGDFPTDRGWDLEHLYDPDPEVPRTCYTRYGGFLVDADEFDAGFFGVAPREALTMDPQQRLLLESSWEALEAAAIDPTSLRKAQVGTFAGVMNQDYGEAPGMTTSIVSGRVAYSLGLEGPAITVDTACSSSLVAIHLAVQALRGGECSLALAGGVTVIATPNGLIYFSGQRGLAPNGRCKSFAESADGVGWGEGVGMLVLERLGDAERNGRSILATIRGSAVNQDGASNGLTAPNGPSQERVIRQALASAGLGTRDVDAIEAHGTGTTLGDPIEAGALLATYGRDRDKPLLLGSIKSNIGHTQAAAGVAGTIKAVLAMREGILPPTLHVDAPTSKVDWSAGRMELLTEPRTWEPGDRPRRVGVSSFGISGTNAHVILEEAPAPAQRTSRPAAVGEKGGSASQTLPGPVPLMLSAKSEPALREAAGRLAAHLRSHPELDPADVAYSLATGRAALERRAVAISPGREEGIEALAAISEGLASAATVEAIARPGRIAYLLTGQGSQRVGMGKELYGSDPAFRESFDEICAHLQPHLERSLAEIVFSEGEEVARLLDDTTYAQPALFALQVALHAALRRRGLEPDLLAGHSIGEISAAHIAGVLSLADAAKLVAARGRLMGALPEGGAMLALEAGEEEVAEAIRGLEGKLAIAAVNAPDSTVLSGVRVAIEAVEADWKKNGRKTKRLAVSHAFHSPLIEPMLEDFRRVAESVEYGEPQMPVISNLTGEVLTAEQAADPDYWVRHAREPVRFMDAARGLASRGATAFLELGPNPVLCAMTEHSLAGEGKELPALIPTLREGRPEPETLSLALGHAHAAGARVEWKVFFEDSGAERVALPTYPFQRKRYWVDASPIAADASAVGQADPDHPLLGASISPPESESLLLTGRLSLRAHPWLADHAVAGTALVPGSTFVELALRAGREVGLETVGDLTVQAPLTVPESGAVQLHVAISGPDEEGDREVVVYARPEGAEEEWVRYAEGTLTSTTPAVSEPVLQWPPEGADPLDADSVQEQLADAGLECGPAFQGLTAAWRCGEDVYAEVSAPEGLAEADRYGVHPALLEAALQGTALLAGVEGEGLRLPLAWRGVSLRSPAAGDLRVKISPAGDGAAVEIADATGAPLVALAVVETRAVETSSLTASTRPLYRLEWSEVEPPAANGAEPLRLAILGESELPVTAVHYRDLEAMLAAVAAGADPPQVVLVDARSAPDVEEQLAAVHTVAHRSLELIRAWSAAPLESGRLTFLTEGAMATAVGEDPELAAAPLVGMLRSARSERPGRFALVDVDGADASQGALQAALDLGEEPEVALREGRALVPRLVRSEVPGEQPGAGIDPDSTVLITGGTSGIGAHVARHLVAEHGARHLLLASRSGPEAEGAAELRAEIEGLGAEVEIAACDVADRDHLAELIEAIPTEHPLGAVVHSAAILDDGVLESLDRERLERVMRPKVDAAWHLHELTEGLPLTQFLLFSSAAGILGGAGQANYAAANAFLDALAQHRRAEGLPATSMAWGLWGPGAGQAEEVDAGVARFVQQIRARLGFEPMGAEQGLELFDLARFSDESLLAPVAFDPAALRAQAHGGTLPAVLRGLVRAGGQRRRGSEALAQRLGRVPEAEREAFALGLVRAEVAAVLGHSSATEVETDRSFKDLGFDSLAAVELRNRLAVVTGLSLPATLVFDYPSTRELAGFVLDAARGEEREAEPTVRASAAGDEPIAIVGIGCRYPGGVGSAQELWELLRAGADGITGFPTDRGWDLDRLYDPDPEHHGTSYTREGGFLPEAVEFDAGFFGIAPREALAMDPQQRLLLETSWEALEDAGFDPRALRGSRTGVFAGIGTSDYTAGFAGHDWLEGFAGSGIAPSVASGRVAYVLGLLGPAISVDTACSSSLVAIHLAVQALRAGECSSALAGGVTVMSSPSVFVFSSRQRGIAPDGRCKSFAEGADGAGFSEGIGVVVLERLSEAERHGHQVLATIRGSATNQDGASNGLTAPHGPAQERVIRQALANAGLEPGAVDAVEAHGTGTALGDPIEAGALLATYGQDREGPLHLGSIKSNIGHTQSAAGVAGVIKMVMAMREGVLPKTLHAGTPSSRIEWSAGKVELLDEPVRWERNGRPRRAGVSSFGMSGTNAHVILEEAPAPPEDEGDPDGAPPPPLGIPAPLALAAKSEPALREMGARLRSHLERNADLDPADVAHSLATARSGFEHRATVLGPDRKQLLGALSALSTGAEDARLARGLARVQGKPVFLFPGHGGQWNGMGRELAEASPRFARKLRECGKALEPHIDWSFERILSGEDEMPPERPEISQPMLFAMVVSLADLWRAAGVEPAAVVGQSAGEIAAAHVAGGLSLEDAARTVALRSKVFQLLAERGRMISVGLGAEQLGPRLERWSGRIEIAVFSGPASTVLAGDHEALEELKGECAEDGVRATEIPGAIAPSHSAHVEVMREELLETFAMISPRSGEIPFHSTVTGEVLDTGELDAEYWYRNLREAVRFEPVLRSLLERGQRAFLDVSPHPVLTLGTQETIEEVLPDPNGAAVLTSLRREEGGSERFALSLAQAYSHGVEVEWERFFEGSGAKRVPLPTYPFQRKRYWLAAATGSTDAGAIGQADPDHPLLGAVVEEPEGKGLTLTGRLSLATHPWLADHALHDVTLVPGAVLVDLALCAGREAGAGAIGELKLEAPLTLPEPGAVQLSVSVGAPQSDGRRSVNVHSRPERAAGEEEDWARNAGGWLSPQPPEEAAAPESLTATWPPEGAEALEVESAYDRLAAAGFDLGPAFQRVRGAWSHGEDLLVEVGLDEAETERFGLHPTLLEAATFPSAEAARPFLWRGVRLHRTGATSLRVLIRPGEDGFSLVAVDESGAPVISIEAVAARSLTPSELGAARRPLYRVEWSARPEGSQEDGFRQGPAELVLAEASVPPQGSGTPPERAAATVRDATERLQAWIAEGPPADARFALLTHNAVATGAGESPDLASAPLWGLLRSAQAEHPGRICLIDTDGSDASKEALESATALATGEPQLALREGVVLVPRLSRVREELGATAGPIFDPDATVLVLTGSDSEAEPGIAELEAELADLGARVTVVACDLADRAQLEQVLTAIPDEHSLGAVVLAAGADGAMGGAWHLHELTEGRQLSHFVLVSAVAGTLGGAGQSDRAAVAGFLDALAVHRRAQGLPAISIAWGERGCSGDLRPALTVGEPLVIPLELDRAALRVSAREGNLPAILRGLVPRPAGQTLRSGSLRERLAVASQDGREDAALDLVRTEMATLLGHSSAEDIDPELAFQGMGADSLAAVELCKRLEASTGVLVPILALTNHPTPRSLAAYLLGELEGPTGSGVAGAMETSFVSLLGRAREEGTLGEFVEMLSSASRFRPSFDLGASDRVLPDPVRLCEGAGSPSLVLISSAGPMSGPQEYVRFAREFHGERSVFVAPLPGFVSGEELPASLEALVELQAESILRSGVGADFVLGGHSSGGWAAHALASHLEAVGTPPAAVILLDSYWPQAELLSQIVPMVLAAVAGGEVDFGVDDVRLTAMGAYRRIFAAWQPEELVALTAMVRAERPALELENADETSWQASWKLPHVLAGVPGDHMTMMQEHADSTADAVRTVLEQVVNSPHSEKGMVTVKGANPQ